MGILGYFCQLVVLVVGLISLLLLHLEANGTLSATSHSRTVLPLILTLIIIAPCSKSSVDIKLPLTP